MNDHIFLQRRYKGKNLDFSKYGCYFLSLCYASQNLSSSPAHFLWTEEDVLTFLTLSQSKGWIDKNFVVQTPADILNHLTGKKWRILEDSKFGLFGSSHFLPINYPVPLQTLEIACYRAKENKDNTHFSIVNEKGKSVFNTLGAYWLTNQKGRFFSLDKRAFVLTS